MKINFIDVGCAGYLPSPWDKEGYGKYIDKIIGFDIMDDELNYLQNDFTNNVVYKNIVFDKEEECFFYICKRNRVSSLFKPNMKILDTYIKYLNNIRKPKRYNIDKYDIIKVKKIKCTRLDTVLNDLDVDFDFLKVDTEGADFNVIKSLGNYLDTQIIGIHTELYFKEMYKGITLFDEVNSFLEDHNFYKVKKMDGVDNFWSNFLYIRDDDNKKEKIDLIKKAYQVRG